jgi:hypothetical protein
MSSISGVSSSLIYGPAYPGSSSSASSAAASLSSAGKGGKSKKSAASNFFSQIEQAVTNALQSAQQSDASDPNDTVQSAIEQVFSQTTLPQGTTPETVASNLSSALGGSADSAHSAFLQTLKAHGIDPEQFTSDFLSAVKAAKNGNASVASALKNLPTGSLLDVAG